MISRQARRGLTLALTLLVSCARKEVKPNLPDLSYLPGDAIFAAYFDSVRLRKAPLYREIDSQLEREDGRWQEARKFLGKLGIDPDRDLEGVILAYRGAPGETGEWLAVLCGRFDLKRIEKGLQEPDAYMSAESYGKRKVYNLVRVPEIGDLSLAVVDSKAVALGKIRSLRKVLDVRDRSAPSLAVNGEMKRLVSGVDPTAQIWAVLDGRELSHRMRERMRQAPDAAATPALKNLSSVKSGRFTMAVSADLSVGLEIESDTEKNARNLSDALEGILAFGKMGTEAGDPDATRLLEAIAVSHDRATLRVRLNLPGEMVKRLRDKYGGPPEAPPSLP